MRSYFAAMRAFAFVALALLTACAASPDEVRRDGVQLTSTALQPPGITVRCLQRDWESQSGESVGQVVPFKSGGYELRIRQMQFGVIAVYQLTPAANSGTAVRAWFRQVFVANADQATLDGQLARCLF